MRKLEILVFLLWLPLAAGALCLQKGRVAEGPSNEACFPMQTNYGDGDGVMVGKVCAKAAENSLSLQMITNRPYKMLRNQVWVGTNVFDVPRLPDRTRVDLAKFPDFSADFEGEAQAQWTLPNPCDESKKRIEKIMFVAHSVVEQGDEGESTEQEAWGYEHLTRSVPAPWFDVKVLCDCLDSL